MVTSVPVDYRARVEAQIGQFREPERLSKLPAIYRYWTKRHLIPRIAAVFGVGSASELYSKALERAANTRLGKTEVARLCSLGAGDCTLEINLAKRLQTAGVRNFGVTCLELSPVRLARGKSAATTAGVEGVMEFVEADLNTWQSPMKFDVFIAHHTLHHVQALEGLYDAVTAAMDENGVFLTADMIGRNGHRRWPETLHWVEHLWRIVPDRYKFQHQFQQLHQTYLDWDCAQAGFEGIRAQDVLPLLLKRLDYDAFLGFGGIIDPFIERGYGHNLDPGNPADLAFVDFVEDLNQALLEAGMIKPTMMVGVFRKSGGKRRCWGPLTASFCVRDTNNLPTAAPGDG